MCCEHLVCASCARPVADAACPVCRASRAELHGAVVQGGPAAMFAVGVLMLLALAAVLYAHLG